MPQLPSSGPKIFYWDFDINVFTNNDNTSISLVNWINYKLVISMLKTVLIKLILSEEFMIVFCIFRLVIPLFTSPLNLLFYSLETTSSIAYFKPKAGIKRSILLLIFSLVLLGSYGIHRPSTYRPPTTYSPTNRPINPILTDPTNLIPSKRLENRKISILQMTNTSEKMLNCT